MSNEAVFYSQIFSQFGSGWLPVVLLVGLLLALLYRPDRVQNWALFRLSCGFLGISVIIAPVLNVLMRFMGGGSASFRSSGVTPDAFMIYAVYALSPILQGISILCGLFSMIPYSSRSPLSPPKHPLE